MAGAWGGKTELAQSAQTANPVTVSPEDKRIPIDRRDEKYKQLNAVGIFLQDNRLAGTGFLVDSCHVLTNAHVAYIEFASSHIIDVNRLHLDEHKSMTFAVGASDKAPKGFKYEIDGNVIAHGNTDGSAQDTENDWAVVKLVASLPTDFPIIPMVQISDKQTKDLRLISVGYPANRTNRGTDFTYLYGDLNCRVVGNMGEGHFAHNCQGTGGNSGGPLLITDPNGFYRAAGMVSGHHFDKTGLEKPNNFEVAQTGVSFGPGLPSYPQYGMAAVPSEGDKILKAIKDSPCP
jgi:V8-like Glu-specific endopeptidase